MTLAILLADRASVVRVPPVDATALEIVIDGTEYEMCSSGGELFYDFVKDKKGNIISIDLHLMAEHPLSQWLRNKSYVTFGPYPQVWFGELRKGSHQGREAFGDIDLFESKNQQWCILLACLWISEAEQRQLLGSV
jgi:hypothetical protein